ncbi:MAG: tRNA (adenosine(37)-N6)-dimethylallyltransferase MiaA, partial [Thermoguttaceae bacterium]|nr:tRNA (adenosine(37)-N6)-dimethylallyltransferase MiaA [Thermoguttaceae bacterium]
HHLIDLVGPDQEFSLAEYLRIAAQKVTEVRGRGKLPLFVGGTPLYLKGLLRGIFEGPPADEPFRSRLRAIEQQRGVGTLHAELMKFDPVTAARLHPNDQKRIIRALEVLEKTGTPISRLQTQFDVISPSNRPRVFVLDWERETLYRRINERVDLMMKQGFLEEVQNLFDSGVALAKTASQAVGYCELGNYLKGEVSLTDAVEQIKQRTRRFAKHQETWFRSLAECHFIPVTEETSLDELRMAIEKLMF